jgi:hypothetical protein
MKSLLKIFHDETVEMQESLRNKFNLLQSPVNFLNEKELKEIQAIFDAYSDKVRKLINSVRNLDPKTEKVERESQILFEGVLNSQEIFGKQLEQYKEEFKIKEKKRVEERDRSQRVFKDRDDSVSDLSDYSGKEKIEISRIFLNSIITTIQVTELMNKNTLKEEQQYIAEIFNLNSQSSKEQILIDYYMNIFKFSLTNKLTIEKISTLLSIMYFVFNYSIMNKKIIKEKCQNIFQDIMDFHTFNRPPFSYEIFTQHEKQLITKFVNLSFFRNYTLFENIFKYNINIYLRSKESRQIPSKNIPKIMKLTPENITQIKEPKSIKALNDLYFEGNIKIVEKQRKILEEEKKKSELEIYEENTMEKLKTFVKSFYKSKSIVETDKVIQDQLKMQKQIDYEVNETKNILDNVIPEIIQEANDRITIANKELLKNVNFNPPEKKK